MSDSDNNKAVVRRYYEEVLNKRHIDVLDEIAVEDYVEHDPFPGQGNGRADLKARVGTLFGAFNPLHFAIEDVIAEGDKVVVRWTNAGTDSGAGSDIHVVRDGRIAEHWHVVDQLAQMQQMCVIRQPGAAAI